MMNANQGAAWGAFLPKRAEAACRKISEDETLKAQEKKKKEEPPDANATVETK
ncbi:MAG TPA: hypothetical protein VGQ87_02095 [Patescibacteria group bacterium]|jgi:hypothetical protein|nr:hypothetical protein [Patescibacteria group bacterium]